MIIKKIKSIIKTIVYKPIGIEIGINSIVKRPFIFSGRKNISIGKDVFIHKNSEILMLKLKDKEYQNGKLSLGDNIYIGKNFHLHFVSNVSIGDDCTISDDVYISAASHGLQPEKGHYLFQELKFDDITIGKNVFIGKNCYLSENIHLGDYCIVGAHSVVTKSFPKYSMIAGCPAKIIKKYNDITKKWEKV